MKPIRTTACDQINKGTSEIVITQKPAEGAHRANFPFTGAVCPLRSEANRYRCRRLGRLLIEPLGRLPENSEAFRAYRPEMSGRGGLLRHEPAQRSKAGIDISGRLRRQPGQK